MTRSSLKNIVVAITLAIAAVATWAVTDSQAPMIDASASSAPSA